MKSERRHELQENVLASYLGRINTAIEPYSKLIVVVLATLVLAVVALAIYQSQTSATRSDATLQLIEASANSDAEVLAEVANRYPNTAAGAWSRLYQGNQYMAEGISALYEDEALAEEQFEQARIAFRKALEIGDDRVLRSRAHFGLARVAESLGEIDAAVEAYQDVVAVHESDAMVDKAQQRIDALSNPQTQDFLAWFHEQDFSPADPSLPPSLPSDSALPDVPDMELPEMDLPDLGEAATGSDAAGEPTDPLELQNPEQGTGTENAGQGTGTEGAAEQGTGTENAEQGAGAQQEGTVPDENDAPADRDDPAANPQEPSSGEASSGDASGGAIEEEPAGGDSPAEVAPDEDNGAS